MFPRRGDTVGSREHEPRPGELRAKEVEARGAGAKSPQECFYEELEKT
ncbi:MAG: hypothetical protein WC985_10680 [Thermoplasmata archaeon]